MLRAAFALFLFCAAAGAAWLIAPRLALLAEARYAAQVDATLTAGGLRWATATVDGLAVTISGAAPSDAAEAEAIAIVSAISPALTVRNAITEAPQIAPTIIPPELEVLKGAEGLILSGVVADTTVATAIGGDSAFLRYGAAPFAADWPQTATLLAEVAKTLRHARFTVTENAIAIDGLAETDEALQTVTPLTASLSELGWRLTLRIDAPPRVLAAFRLTAVKTATGAKVSCAAATPADADAIKAVATTTLAVQPTCDIGAGAPDDDWVDAASAMLAALAEVEAGEVLLSAKIAALTLTPPTSPENAASARDILATSLPAGYRFSLDDSAITPESDAPPPFDLLISWPGGADAIAISSIQAGDGLTRVQATLGAYARALFPGSSTVFSTEQGAKPPDGWRRATRIALEALSNLARGDVQMSDGEIKLYGTAAQLSDVRTAHDALSTIGEGWRVTTRIAYNPAIIAAAQPLPPARCAAAVAGTITEAPISFQPASATLTPSGKSTVDRIAAILTRCAGARFEIGGHTDAQGSEGGNLALSRNRAEAVLSALIAAKAPPGRLVARGYGEARPIADNATAVGRALNRRIEFTLIEDKE